LGERLPGGALVGDAITFIEGGLVANSTLVRPGGEGGVGDGNFDGAHVFDFFPADDAFFGLAFTGQTNADAEESAMP
jgi:hypothetical protein